MNPQCSVRRETRGAFTLVELLMVIVIIGILVGLGTAAFIAARGRAINARMTAEIGSLGQAIEKYRQDHGEYFPNPFTADGSKSQNKPWGETLDQRKNRFEQHLRKAFPRYLGNYDQFRQDVFAATRAGNYSKFQNGLDVNHLDSAEVLVFFLGGLPNLATETPLTGFAADPQNPFKTAANDPSAPTNAQQQPVSARTAVLFNFDTGRLQDYDGDGWQEYVPAVEVSSGKTPPYVYFDYRSYDKGAHYPADAQPTAILPPNLQAVQQMGRDWGFATPYLSKAVSGNLPRAYLEPKKFQIICCGRDGMYSEAGLQYNASDPRFQRVFPDTLNFTLGDNDNLSSFTSSTLDSEKP